MSNVIYLDLGPGILGYPAEIKGSTVCVLSSKAATDHAIQARVRRFMKAEGRDCGTCGACPVGRAL